MNNPLEMFKSEMEYLKQRFDTWEKGEVAALKEKVTKLEDDVQRLLAIVRPK